MSEPVPSAPATTVPLGAHPRDGGTEFALWAPRAERVELARDHADLAPVLRRLGLELLGQVAFPTPADVIYLLGYPIVGFGLLLLGALISTSRQNEVSRNTRNMDLRFLNEGFDNNEDILLYRGDTVLMGEHFVRYNAKRQEGVNLFFDMDYFAAVPRSYSTGDTVRVAGAGHSFAPLCVTSGSVKLSTAAAAEAMAEERADAEDQDDSS